MAAPINNAAKGRTGPDAFRWKGGRHVAWNGYVRVLKRDHPRALSNGYVWEHIIVAEQMVGRPLKYFGKGDKRNETVHHINGKKTDNRPQNLMILSACDHSALEWRENPEKYPQSKHSQRYQKAKFALWKKKNTDRLKKSTS